MCKHVLNAQVSIQAPCCKRWYECEECHGDVESHPLQHTSLVSFCCKACRAIFQKDLGCFDDEDKVCPQCKNCFVLPAETPEGNFTKFALEILKKELDEVLDEF